MKPLGRPPRKSSETSVSFPRLECWNPMTKTVSIAADVGGRRVLCRITQSVLEACFETQGAHPRDTVVAHRPRIEQAARSLIDGNGFPDGGAIDIERSDLDLEPA